MAAVKCTCGGNGICINCVVTQFSEPVEYCSICSECIFSEPAEMHDPNDPLNGGLVHAQCGLHAGWEVS